MALLDEISLGNIAIMEVDQPPNTGGGIAAPEGAVAIVSSVGQGAFWQKIGPLDTDWVVFLSGTDPSSFNGRIINVGFYSDDDSWAKWSTNHNKKTDELPYRIPFGSKLIGYNLSFKGNNDSFYLEFYKNGTLTANRVFQQQYSNINQAVNITMTPISFSAGDELALRFKKISGSDVDDAYVELFFAIVDDTAINNTWNLGV